MNLEPALISFEQKGLECSSFDNMWALMSFLSNYACVYSSCWEGSVGATDLSCLRSLRRGHEPPLCKYTAGQVWRITLSPWTHTHTHKYPIYPNFISIQTKRRPAKTKWTKPVTTNLTLHIICRICNVTRYIQCFGYEPHNSPPSPTLIVCPTPWFFISINLLLPIKNRLIGEF